MSLNYELVKETAEEIVYKNTETKITHTLIPVWSIDNDEYLVFKNMMNMPAKRLLVFQNIQQLEKIGMLKNELLKFMGEIKKEAKDGDTHSIYAKAEYIEQSLKDHWDFSKTIIAIIPLCVIKKSEVQFMNEYDQELCNKKI